jgi:hypothetical protein
MPSVRHWVKGLATMRVVLSVDLAVVVAVAGICSASSEVLRVERSVRISWGSVTLVRAARPISMRAACLHGS